MIGFDYQPRTRLVFGPGTIPRLGELARELGGGTALLVTDPGVAAAGHADRALDAVRAAGLRVRLFADVIENPTTDTVDACLRAARGVNCDLIIGLGGGSAIDTAKGCNFLLTNGGAMRDYLGSGKAARPMLPMIAIPTTAGTGSECQSYALIADAHSHRKMACGDPKAAPRVAILDPELTLTLPRQVTLATGADALAHALESAVTAKRNPLSSLYAREAFALVYPNLPRVLGGPADFDARAAMLLGAAFAGTAIELSMLGAAHAAANPLTANFGLTHGLAVGLMLPHVMRFNAESAEVCDIYAKLAEASGMKADAHALIDVVDALFRRCGVPSTLSAAGAATAPMDALADQAAEEWTGRFNPRPLTRDDFAALYRAAA